MKKLLLILILAFTYTKAKTSDAKFLRFAVIVPKDVNLSNDIYKNIDTMSTSANRWMQTQTGKQIRFRKTKENNLDIELIKLNETSKEILDIGHKLPFHIYKKLKKKYEENKDIVVFLFASDVNLKSKSYCGMRTGRFAGLYINNARCRHKYDSGEYQGWDKIFIHETIHALGGVEKCAKNSDGKYHVSDFASDIMHKNGGGKRPQIDINRDDYFGHNIDGCFDLNKSKLLY